MLQVISGVFLSLYIVGDSLKSLLKKYIMPSKDSIIYEFACSVLLSFSYFLCISIVLAYQYSLDKISIAFVLITTVAIADFIKLAFRRKGDFQEHLVKKNYKVLLPIIPLIFLGAAIAFLFRNNFSWPSMPGWDQYAYLGGSNWIFAHNGTINLIPTSTGIILPASYLFQTFVASISIFIGVTPYLIFWSAPFLTIPLYGFLIYGVAFFFTKKMAYSFFASLFALTISGGESLLGPQYFFPSTLSIIIFLLILIFILGFEKNTLLNIALSIFFIALFYVTYYFPIIVTFPVFLVLLISKKPADSWFNKHFIIFSSMLSIIMMGISWIGASLLSTDTLSIYQKLDIINTAYPIIFWFLFLTGALILLKKYFDKSFSDKNLLLLLIYTMSLLVICLLPPISSIRTEIFFRGFSAIIASFTLVLVYEALSFRQTSVKLSSMSRRLFRKSTLAVPCIFLFMTAFFLIQPYIAYSESVPYYSNISNDEYLAAKWIRQNTLPNIYILTDPSTGYVFRGLTIRNCSTSFLINGYTPSPADQLNLTTSISQFFEEEDVSKLPDYYSEFPKKPHLIVITTRTVEWINSHKLNVTIYTPVNDILLPFQGMAKFSSPFFTLLKSWQTVSIYRPTNASVEPVWLDESFSNGWSDWYLDGAYKNYSSARSDASLSIAVQAESNQNAWTGLTQQLPNVSSAVFMKIKYKIDVPCYQLEIVMWRSEGDWIIHGLEQSQEFTEQTFTLTEQEAASLYKIGILVWTRDTLIHVAEVKYVLFGKYVS